MNIFIRTLLELVFLNLGGFLFVNKIGTNAIENKIEIIEQYRIECFYNPLSGIAKYNITPLSIDNNNIKQETVYQQLPETVNNNVVNSWFPSIRIIRDEHWKDERKSIISTGSASGYAKDKVGNDVYANDKEALSEYAKNHLLCCGLIKTNVKFKM